MPKHLIKVNTDAEALEAQKNLEEPFVILVKDENKLIYQDDTHCDVVMLIDDWNNYHTEIPVILRDISWIKGCRCLVKKTDDGVAICYLDENNSELFHDGVTPAKLDGTMGQWMTDLPEFNILCLQGKSDWVKLHISKDLEIGHKSRRVLLGVTKGIVENNKLYSKVAERGLITCSLTDACTYANNVGEGFDIIDYETHCKLAYMFMSKYKTKDSSTYFRPTALLNNLGATKSLGNKDGKSTYNSIFGVESPFDGYTECLGGIHYYNDAGGLMYYMYDGVHLESSPLTQYRSIGPIYNTSIVNTDITLNIPILSTISGYISRMYYGEYADLVPIEFSGSSKYFYPDYASTGSNSEELRFATRILLETNLDLTQYPGSGVFGISFAINNPKHSGSLTSRLLYRGNIQVIEDPQEFINLPVGF